MRALKREGDGATPRGLLRLREVFYRADRVARPCTRLPVRAIRPADGWCDADGDRNYNRPVLLPYQASAEAMWRTDGLYDLLGVLGHNDLPRRQGRGSCIFLHIAHEDLAPTAGCIALARKDLIKLLSSPVPLRAIAVGR
jgi:L,D-peptidoglycan transpeptidase YkuD (ErfK/YbiS/YcfS/YnhG family)